VQLVVVCLVDGQTLPQVPLVQQALHQAFRPVPLRPVAVPAG